MTTVRDLMSTTPAATSPGETLCDAARTMRDRHVGVLPVCGPDQRLDGLLTDRDIVVGGVASGKDPRRMTVSAMTLRVARSVDVDDTLEVALAAFVEDATRSLPVTDAGRLVGSLRQSDVARSLSPATISSVLTGREPVRGLRG